MRKIIESIVLIIFVLSIFTISGCSSDKRSARFGEMKDFGKETNLTPEEKQQMFEEMQLKMQEACNNKFVGDECQLENPRGSIKGTCELQDDNLTCKSDQQMGRRFE